MIINDLPCLAIISAQDKITGGRQNDSYSNQSVAIAQTYADGSNVLAAAGTLVYLDRGVSKAQSFSSAQSLG